MNWPMMQDMYLAFTRIFDGFLNFFAKIFGKKEDEE